MFENVQLSDDLRPSDPRFGSGPSLVPVEFMKTLAQTGAELLGTSHRKPVVRNLVKEMQEGVRQYFHVPEDYSIVLGNGGATLLFDMIGLGIVEKKITHHTCGEFSQKWFKSSNLIPWIDAQEVAVDYGQGVDATNVADSDVIAVTLNETSTGVQIKGLPEVDKDTILAVDATSGAGQVPCDVSKTDMFFFSPQKVFASEGGLWVAIISPKARERALRLAEDKSRYIPPIMSWKLAINNSDKNQTYNTPAIATIYFLNEQLKLMNELGYEKVMKMAQDKADLIYNWANEKSYLSNFIQDDGYKSVACATVDLDDKVSVDDVIKFLEDKGWVYGIDGYRKLGRNQFRISLFHNITYDDLEKLTKVISTLVESEL